MSNVFCKKTVSAPPLPSESKGEPYRDNKPENIAHPDGSVSRIVFTDCAPVLSSSFIAKHLEHNDIPHFHQKLPWWDITICPHMVSL